MAKAKKGKSKKVVPAANSKVVPQTEKMKTAVPDDIRNTKQARKFLRELYANGESFHPEDSPASVGNGDATHWYPLFSDEDAKRVEVAMDKINALPNFDACGYILELDKKGETAVGAYE